MVGEGLLEILLNVKHNGGSLRGSGRAHRGAGGGSSSGHSSSLGYVAGGQACHLHGGALSGASLGWRCFGGAEAVASVPPYCSDDDAAGRVL